MYCMQYTLGDGDVDEETGLNARQSADNGSTYTSKHDSGLRGVRTYTASRNLYEEMMELKLTRACGLNRKM